MWIKSIKSLVGSSERVAGICRSVRSFVSDSMFGLGSDLTSPGEARTSPWAQVSAGGYAQNLGRASSLAIPSSCDRQVTTRVSLALDSTASAQMQFPSGPEQPPATAPSAMVIPPCSSRLLFRGRLLWWNCPHCPQGLCSRVQPLVCFRMPSWSPNPSHSDSFCRRLCRNFGRGPHPRNPIKF